MNIAIYSRKSKKSDQGDSICNQINMCKEYIFNNFNNIQIVYIYIDNGFSGSNENRPMFKKMITDSKSGLFSLLVCYRLDRISRSIADFSSTYEKFDMYSIKFISIKEQFDTSSPIGRAMLNIAMVFAQLERETIAERIQDNMCELAKSGQWLGGITPTGFESSVLNESGKKTYKLSPIKTELVIVRIIYNKFLELKSLRKVQRYLTKQNIKTKNNCSFSAATIRDILVNPVYVKADKAIFLYFTNLNAKVYGDIEDYNGERGVLVYNKTNQEKGISRINNTEKWIVAISNHKGIIKGDMWIKIQGILRKNRARK